MDRLISLLIPVCIAAGRGLIFLLAVDLGAKKRGAGRRGDTDDSNERYSKSMPS